MVVQHREVAVQMHGKENCVMSLSEWRRPRTYYSQGSRVSPILSCSPSFVMRDLSFEKRVGNNCSFSTHMVVDDFFNDVSC